MGKNKAMLRTGPTIVWHYTTGSNWEGIDADGRINPATANISKGERPVVWFSRADPWEPTAAKAWQFANGSVVRLTREQTHLKFRGLVRIGVSTSNVPLRWSDFEEQQVASPSEIRLLEVSGRSQGANPRSWFWRFEPVPRAEWSQVEFWNGAAWGSTRVHVEEPEQMIVGPGNVWLRPPR
ncbi:MAG: hypothetical protein EPO40_21935 [Myxococcaceae bacterium]|nr:MAG: hypothetical protein EPO40_21935 [Myxococcaceae bacterium]